MVVVGGSSTNSRSINGKEGVSAGVSGEVERGQGEAEKEEGSVCTFSSQPCLQMPDYTAMRMNASIAVY